MLQIRNKNKLILNNLNSEEFKLFLITLCKEIIICDFLRNKVITHNMIFEGFFAISPS